jgi:hypothetical protein
VTYLIDADVLITAKNVYYAFDLVPAFWSWLEEKIEVGTVDTAARIRQEWMRGRDDDPLKQWVLAQPTLGRDPTAATVQSMRELSAWADAEPRFTAGAKAAFFGSGDYYLVAEAMAHGDTVVTLETPQPLGKASVKIPDASARFDVDVVTTFEMLRREGASF